VSRLVTILLVAACLAVPLAACGKKGDPKAPGADQFPRTYPKPEK
jgi:predicted small lipoprotein YifL